MEFGAEIQKIDSREALARFVRMLAEEARSPAADWENRDLGAFLNALASWLADFDDWEKGREKSKPVAPSWRAIAEMLWAASMYE